ncbi:hypothetical protein [Catalinimonas niigatensis]|uniref:hypothetical protein n=1 Tax=Catalinimonas niigatensis TaxID=1397264 RepID=UPI002666F363|nr:hypothetical protein [Catalinimonas niigatensis]WPP51880.1 hypothetical protein PZB72_05695 [Catalinimonas niigatensis]
MKKIIFIFISLILIADTINAQHEEHPQESNEHQDMPDSIQAPMSHAFSLSLPMTRNGSGTGWLPDLSPMYGYLDEVYGNNPLAGQVYLRIYPQLMQIPGISKKHMHDMHH